MSKHCKGCRHHHTAKYGKDNHHLVKYNDWCCKYGQFASKVKGHCKLNNGREE